MIMVTIITILTMMTNTDLYPFIIHLDIIVLTILKPKSY